MQYKIGDIVFAKCQNYPFWPGKVISLLGSEGAAYKILFYGQKSEATIDDNFILPFTQDISRKIMNEGNNRYNRQLKHSIQIAHKRFNKRKKGQASNSQDDDFFQESEPTSKRTQIQQAHRSKKVVHYKTPEDPHLELSNLLNNLGNEAATFNQSKVKRVKFTQQNQCRLRQLLDPTFGLQIKSLVQLRVIEKFIIVLKQIDLWGLKLDSDIIKVVKSRYEQFKNYILSESFSSVEVREARKQIIIQKVMTNRAVV